MQRSVMALTLTGHMWPLTETFFGSYWQHFGQWIKSWSFMNSVSSTEFPFYHFIWKQVPWVGYPVSKWRSSSSWKEAVFFQFEAVTSGSLWQISSEEGFLINVIHPFAYLERLNHIRPFSPIGKSRQTKGFESLFIWFLPYRFHHPCCPSLHCL